VTEWKERLRALDDLGPNDNVYRRALEGPRRGESPDGPSGPTRLAAGIVAFVAFAAAAIFGWQAFRPNDRPEPVGPQASPAVITLEGTDEGPTATLSFDGAEQAGVFEGYSWCSTPDDCDTITFDFNYPPLDDAVAVPAGTPIRFDGDGRVERLVIRTTEGGRPSPNVVTDSDGTDASVPSDPGDYMLWVAADWERGSGAFYLRVRVVPPVADFEETTGVPLSAEGTSFLLPDGWQGRADALPGYTRRIFQLATFGLPTLANIEASEARTSVGADDVLVTLNEFSSLCPPCPSESEGLPVSISFEDLEGAHDFPRWLPPLDDLPLGSSLARRIFRVGPRYFDLTVQFGSHPEQADLDRVNDVVGTLAIGEWVAEPNGSCQWNELGMRDPDCPEGDWLRGVVSEAGFEYKDTAGSPVASKGPAEFFISVEDEERVPNDRRELLRDPSAFPINEEVGGIVVYGNEQEWAWFANGVLVSVSLGPDGESVFPTIDQLRPLVEASTATPFPPS
jgi:hypothetical protein